MNDRGSADQGDAEASFLERVVRYQDGSLSPAEIADFDAELRADVAKQRLFTDLHVRSAMIRESMRREAFEPVAPQSPRIAAGRIPSLVAAVMAIALSLAVAVPLAWWLPNRHGETLGHREINSSLAASETRLAGASRAQFFGELVPKVDSVLAPRRDYVLTSGLVELAFPSGASAIIEGPAVFRLTAADSLALDTGKCSVHAPDGAEGFRVETPLTRIVDRGTRFTVSVAETSDTEVHVVEGAADVYRRSEEIAAPSVFTASKVSPEPVRLAGQEAKRFAGSEAGAIASAPFTADLYRRRLPDRVLSYQATTGADGEAVDLTQVTLQRGGIDRTYSVAEIIPVELTWFKGTGPNRHGHLTGGLALPSSRRDQLSDASLQTGVINPGGEATPLTSNPVMQSPEDPDHPNTPGFAVRFRRPVTNGPGPDVVFFELQTPSNPLNGDAFHVSPLRFTSSLRSHTVRGYDLTLHSPEALKVSAFYLYRFPNAVGSLEDLQNSPCVRTPIRLGFRVLAVGIDLTDLGFKIGEQVDGLFFQDASDDGDHAVDPVLIAGLPDVPAAE